MSTRRFTTRPIEVEAIQVREALLTAEQDWSSLPAWLADLYEDGHVTFGPGWIELSCTRSSALDNWLVLTVVGTSRKFGLLSNEKFEALYAPVEGDGT